MMIEHDLVMEELSEYRQGLISALEVVSGALAVCVAKIPPDRWHIPGLPGGYSPHYLLTRLLVLEDQVYAAQVRRILDEDVRMLPLFDEVAWLALHYDPEIPLPQILVEFTSLREQVVKRLSSLLPGDWNRLTRHPRWGVRTLQWWVEFQLKVSQLHLQELESTLAR